MRKNKGYTLAYVVVCMTLILILVATTFTFVNLKTRAVNKYINKVNIRLQVIEWGEEFIENGSIEETREDYDIKIIDSENKELTISMQSKTLLKVVITDTTEPKVLEYKLYC